MQKEPPRLGVVEGPEAGPEGGDADVRGPGSEVAGSGARLPAEMAESVVAGRGDADVRGPGSEVAGSGAGGGGDAEVRVSSAEVAERGVDDAGRRERRGADAGRRSMDARNDATGTPGRKNLRYQTIRETVRREIEGGRFAPGERLPSDSELGLRFDASRLTVIRALRELESEGLVQRKAGSGTFVRTAAPATTLVFGILMPDLGDGEVFEPIAQGIARAGELQHHRMLWGSAAASGQVKEGYAEDLCRYFISRKVSGVFFSPVELTAHQDDVNRKIAAELTAAGIPIVLVDRCVCAYPERSRHDLVGIDNHRAGYRMTRHLLTAGCRRVAFGFRPGSAPTVDARMAGYFAAVRASGGQAELPLPLAFEPADRAAGELARFMEREQPDGIVCANDLTAARLMHQLLKLGVRIPEEVRLAGINDVKYAGFLPVPLTTLRQPCQQIGAAAMAAMIDRLENPGMPVRDVLLDCELVVRQSCGTER